MVHAQLSLDLKFKPRNTTISSRPGEERYMCKTVFTQCDLQEDWCAEQKDVWIGGVKTLSHRPLRCQITVHPYFLRTDAPKRKIVRQRPVFFIRPVQRQACDVEQETRERNSETFMTGTNRAPRNLLTNTISHSQTITYTMISAIKASKKAVGPGTERISIY